MTSASESSRERESLQVLLTLVGEAETMKMEENDENKGEEFLPHVLPSLSIFRSFAAV